MSLPKARNLSGWPSIAKSRRLGTMAGALLVCALLAGCGSGGFRPMYAASADGSRLSEKLREVSVTTIPGRVGQILRNELKFQTTGGGNEVAPRYRLDIALTERLVSTLVDAQGESLSQVYSIDATFTLHDVKSQKAVFSGISTGRAGFERVSSIYANVRSREGAESRAARTVATDIKTRLEAFLANS